MKTSNSAVGLAIVLVLTVVSGGTAATIEDTIGQTLAFAPGDRLEVTNTNGDIEVRTWDRNEIQIEARKRVKASSEERARTAFDDLRVKIDQTGSGVTIDTDYPKGPNGWWGNVSSSVHYEILIPRQADLDLETVNGKVTVTGVHGEIEVGTTNGGIEVEDSGGSVSARTTNGGIEVELQEVMPDENMTFRSTNGGITLTLPSQIAADISARTTNGSVQTDFPITVQGTFRKNRLDGSLNGGGADIELKTTNGSIRIREM